MTLRLVGTAAYLCVAVASTASCGSATDEGLFNESGVTAPLNEYCGSTAWRQCSALATFCNVSQQVRDAVTCN